MAKEFSHKYARQDLKALLEERNKQNAFLREQLAARAERAAHLEARLLSTLDTLDEVQSSGIDELQQVQRENARLVEKLDLWQAIARAADREKSDMSNAVLQLVAKVESCNDYSKWRASRIEFSHDINLHPVRPARNSPITPAYESSENCTCAHAYSPAIVEELSDSLSREKHAHALTIEEAERRIAALQSRVARRDAEIMRRAATCRCRPTSSLDVSAHLELMSEEEQARVSARTAEMNRVLESDIAQLDEKVKRETRTRRSSSSRLVNRCVQTDSKVTSRSPRDANPAVKATTSDDDDAVPAALSALDSQIGQLRNRLTDLVKEKEALRFVLRDELNVQDPVLQLSPQQVKLAEILNDDRLNDRDANRSGRGTKGQDGFEDILLLEEECIRLMHSEDNLRESLEHLRHRYSILSEENELLKDEIAKLRIAETIADDRPSPSSLPPLDTSAIDLAFPPLQPDSTSPVFVNADQRDEPSAPGRTDRTTHTGSSSSASSSNSPLTLTSIIEPSEVPLPLTPTFDDAEPELEDDDGDDMHVETGESELRAALSRPSTPLLPQEPTSPILPDAPTRPAEARDAQAIEHELADARADAEMRERDIAEVRDLMVDLASRIEGELHES